MGDNAKPKKNIEELEIKVFQKNENKMGETRLRLVSWVIDGKKTAPMFEKRSFILREYKGVNNLQMSKAKGFTREDMVFMRDHMDEILADMAEFVKAGHDQEVATAQNKDFSMADEEKIADEMFS